MGESANVQTIRLSGGAELNVRAEALARVKYPFAGRHLL
jgi:hypothetical protein